MFGKERAKKSSGPGYHYFIIDLLSNSTISKYQLILFESNKHVSVDVNKF